MDSGRARSGDTPRASPSLVRRGILTDGSRSLSTVVALVACLASGCTIARYYNGTPLRSDPAKLVEGQSVREDVLRLFGPPTQIIHRTDGDAFEYTYQQYNYSSLQLQDPITGINWFTYTREFDNRDRLLVLFDFTGVVRSVAVDHHVGEMPVL